MTTNIQNGFVVPLPALRGGTGRTTVNAWDGLIIGAAGDGNPWPLLLGMNQSVISGPSPTQIGTTFARICYFRPSAAIVVNKIRYYGCASTTGVYFVAIYNGDTLARLTAELQADTPNKAWGSAGSSLALSLTAGQLYFIAISVHSTGAQAGPMSFTASASNVANLFSVLPKSWPGSLDIDAGIVPAMALAEFPTTAGALPDPAGTIQIQTNGILGGMPAFFLDNSNA